ncbi:acyl-CoA dehydrogenase family protein [Corynebacterium terpenotabidum]|uniref:Acyl-CoA dehydrogenase n=1 Tax=Corynebacterium terpenotabidum Y-11 TaxID=1200352 RepID=S4XDD6_9CORY|nr:acyl-CoA dehydrogenase family protein [Corynebacterium terpenotabidum]AGP30534.1 acyl-CoA dehydrogenase [Corynebacterium terpenotabidum Y-11]
MDLSLNDEQQMLADAVRDLFSGADGDPTAGGEAPENGLDFRRDLWNQAAEMGLTALPIAEEHGGAGAGIAEVWATTSTLGTLGAPEPLVDAAYVPAWLIADLGTADQKTAWLSRIAAGEAVVPLAHAEKGTGWDADRGATVTDGALTGVKRAVVVADVADAFLVTAVADGVPGVFLVAADAAGVSVDVHRDAEWVRTATVSFDGAPAEKLGDPDAATVTASLRRVTALARIAQGGRAVGLMETALKLTVDYLKVRKQFGVTLNRFQTLTQRCAQMFSDVELARSMSLWAAAAAESFPGTVETLSDSDLEALAATALDSHNFLVRQARVIAEEAVQLHGGIGVTYEAAVSHYAAALTGFRQLYGGELGARSAGVSSASPESAPSALLNNELIP